MTFGHEGELWTAPMEKGAPAGDPAERLWTGVGNQRGTRIVIRAPTPA